MAFELGNVVKTEWLLRFPDDVEARPRELSVVTRIIVTCTAFKRIDGAQIILKSQNEATAHDQRSPTWFTNAQLFEKLKFVLFRCVSYNGK